MISQSLEQFYQQTIKKTQKTQKLNKSVAEITIRTSLKVFTRKVLVVV